MLSQLFQPKDKKIVKLFYNELFYKKDVCFLDKQGASGNEQEIYKLIREYDFDKENKKLLSIVLASIVRKFATTKKNCEVNLDFELEIIHELLEKGANPNTKFKGDKAIYKDICSELHKDDIIEIYQRKLEKYGKYNDIYKDIVDGEIRPHHITFSNFTTSSITALHIAAYYGAIDLVKKLLEKKVDPNVKDQKGNTAMHFVLAAIVRKKNFFDKTEQLESYVFSQIERPESDASSHFEVLKLLALAGANTNISIHCTNFSRHHSYGYDYTPIYLAVVCGKLYVVSALIECGTDVNSIDTFRYSPLGYAIEREDCKLVKLLVENGAIVYWRCNGKEMLEYAVEHEMEYISFLLLVHYHKMREGFPVLYQVMELCFEKILSRNLVMESIDNINEFINTITESKSLLEEELSGWKGYLESYNFSAASNNLCGFDALKNIVEKATERLTHRITQIEQCSNSREKSKSLDRKNFPQEKSVQQVQCLLQDENNKEGKSQGKRRFTVGNLKETNSQRTQCLLQDQDNNEDKLPSRWQLVADNLKETNSQRAQSQSRWQLIARRLRDLIGFDESNDFDKSNEVSSRLSQTQSDKVSSRLSQTRVVSKSTVDLLM